MHLWKAINKADYRDTLFVLDGLDEVSEGLDERHGMFKFLEFLLNLPAVIVTSRPHIPLPQWLKRPYDLELETIGFTPDQVTAYIMRAFTMTDTDQLDMERVRGVQSFLRRHQLLRDLMRIPIQLDALCYVWNDNSNVHLEMHEGP